MCIQTQHFCVLKTEMYEYYLHVIVSKLICDQLNGVMVFVEH